MQPTPVVGAPIDWRPPPYVPSESGQSYTDVVARGGGGINPVVGTNPDGTPIRLFDRPAELDLIAVPPGGRGQPPYTGGTLGTGYSPLRPDRPPSRRGMGGDPTGVALQDDRWDLSGGVPTGQSPGAQQALLAPPASEQAAGQPSTYGEGSGILGTSVKPDPRTTLLNQPLKTMAEQSSPQIMQTMGPKSLDQRYSSSPEYGEGPRGGRRGPNMASGIDGQTRNALDELNLLQGRTYPPPLSPVPPPPVTRPLTPGKPGPIFVPPNKQIGVPPRRPVMQPPVMPRPPNPRRGLRQPRAFASQARGRK
jgi:hypothetical protein